jgi:hypothetical protein
MSPFIIGLVVLILLCACGLWLLAQEKDELSKHFQDYRRNAEQHLRNAEVEYDAYKRKIKQLEFELASRIAPSNERPITRLTVPTDKTEVFLPVLDPGRVYQITFEGACTFMESSGWFSERSAALDALYRTDEAGNFATKHGLVTLGNKPIRDYLSNAPREAEVMEDRQAHRYAFRVDGIAQRISVCLKESLGPSDGRLTVQIDPLPEGTASPGAALRREREAQKAARHVEQIEAERAAHEAKRVAVQADLERLKRRIHVDSHYTDQKFQEDFAKHHRDKVQRILKKQWENEYERFVKNVPLKVLAEEQAPEVIQFFEARVKIVQLAERIEVTPTPPPKEITPEERRLVMVREKGKKVDDWIAATKLKGEKIAEAKAVIETIDVDEDEKDRLTNELVEEIFEGEANHHGKGSVTL